MDTQVSYLYTHTHTHTHTCTHTHIYKKRKKQIKKKRKQNPIVYSTVEERNKKRKYESSDRILSMPI